jgi:folate-dependent phosphoribosylglycinamide formyltransferase PurN
MNAIDGLITYGARLVFRQPQCVSQRLTWKMRQATEFPSEAVSPMNIGLLSTHNDPLLGRLMHELAAEELVPVAVILDSKQCSERDLAIHQERTEGLLPPIPLHELQRFRIPFYFVDDHRSPETVRLVDSLGIDLLVDAGTPRILTASILNAPTIGVVSCHPGLLPHFRGCTCVEWAIFLDEQVGNTIYFMDEGIDEGPIILQEPLEFHKKDRYPDVRAKVYRSGQQLLARAIKLICSRNLRPGLLELQGEGRYFPVIDDEKLAAVKAKLAAGGYAYQR